jgi:hypothetical protein
MGLWADTINKLKDTLDAAIVTGQALEEFTIVHFGEMDTVTTLTPPYLWLHVDTPPVAEDWHAAKDRRRATFTCLVHVVMRPQDKARPYGVTGDATKQGPLVGAADVMNLIDSERAALLAVNAKNIDMNLGVRSLTNIGDRNFETVITVDFLQRFGAAGR